jgi:hypothetical protein
MLEVVIAMALVGFFSIYFLHSAIKHLHQERQALLELEIEQAKRLKIAEILSDSWPKDGVFIQPPPEAISFDITLNKRAYKSKPYTFELTAKDTSTAFRLDLHVNKERKHYYFFAKK